MIRAAFVIGSMVVVATTPAIASPRIVEIGGNVGVHIFSDENELGVPDIAKAPSQQNAFAFGLRVGILLVEKLGLEGGLEGEANLMPTTARQVSISVWDLTYRAHVIAQLSDHDRTRKLVPFVVFGGGAFQVIHSNGQGVISNDADALLYTGVGAKYALPSDWGLRLDGRLMFPPSSMSTGITADWEVLLSGYREFGRARPDLDPDHDGIFGAKDKCPLDPEDKDGFQDDDGCPDLDNDQDGIPDAADKCPNEPEDKDGFQDQDGCPDPDNDSDGIPDTTDKCPNEPEDKDGFQDDDGCPDPDNDQDGIPDAADKCPNDPETKNGFEDEDGCPDQVPTQIKQFTGAVRGINFKSGTADILASSNKTLDEAVAVLIEYPSLQLEIQGHTDDQPVIRGSKFKDNVELSQARAEAVKAYMVTKGVDSSRLVAKGYGEAVWIEEYKTLKGGALAAAQAKNRRVEFHPIVSNTPAPVPAPAPPAPTPSGPPPAPTAPPATQAPAQP